jgi:hypothetical protein
MKTAQAGRENNQIKTGAKPMKRKAKVYKIIVKKKIKKRDFIIVMKT